jgi:SAM-dependent methyltransferase
MGALYSVTIFISAFLLFLIQPMFSKMVLPLMGGGASVWNTCILFFQLTLLAGYLYTHLATTYLGVRRHMWTHVALLCLTVLALPVRLSLGAPPVGADPVGWLLLLLTVSIALPFFFLSTTAPLLQRWYADTGRPDAESPYFLYSAGYAGSLLALLAYPSLVEPRLRLVEQRSAWSVVYAVLIVLISACALLTRRLGGSAAPATASPEPSDRTPPRSVLRWVLLALVPSGMMLAITTYLTTDITPAPLLWVIPLGLYLLSFVLVFARHPWPSHRFWVRVQPLFLTAVALLLFWGSARIAPLVIPFHLLAFFVTAMVCHGELVRTRPPVAGMTAFYLWMSVGGALGGVFCAIVAPMVFKGIGEYPWLIVGACALRPRLAHRRGFGLAEFFLLPGVGLLALITTIRITGAGSLHVGSLPFRALVLAAFALTLVVLYRLRNEPLRLAVGTGLVLAVSPLILGLLAGNVYAKRNFYGARHIRDDGVTLTLMHGSTNHGAQYKNPKRRPEPITYYDWRGPVGDIFRTLPPPPIPVRVGVLGLGTGTLAAYGRPGDRFDFYEIDPEVVTMTTSGRWFTYLELTPAEVHVLLGDGRLRLAEAADGTYDLIVLDAFNSDAVPVHLITREAAQMYFRKLKPGGVLAIHLSNRFLDLKPVAAALAADLGYPMRIRVAAPGPSRMLAGSVWAVLARDSVQLGPLAAWSRSVAGSPVRVWTDDYSNVLSVVKW